MGALLALAAGCEALTGLGLMIDPSLVAGLIFGADLPGAASR